MAQEITQYEYSFEIEDILKQFIALIDNAIVMRYEKVENERRLVQTITPLYKFTTKNRTLLLTLNANKNVVLPCVTIDVTGISADKQRIAGKNNKIIRFQYGLLEGYKRPTPITINLKVSIITKFITDLWQIYGKLATQFQPELFISWAVPTNAGLNGIEELRNKVEWDFNASFDNREKVTEDDEDRFVCTMSFSVQGWLFPTQRECQGPPILDIGTTVLVSNELEKRIDGLIDKDNPLVSEWLKNKHELYKNPREFANAHVRILKAFSTVDKFHFRIMENQYDKFNLKKRNTLITLDGYNLDRAEVLFVPLNNESSKNIKSLIEYTYDDKGKLWPVIGEETPKKDVIRGIPLNVVSQSKNVLTFELPTIEYTGEYDIIVFDEIDYDSLSKGCGFTLKSL